MSDVFNDHNFSRQQAAETVAEIAPNRTLITGQLTAAVPLKPAVVQGLQNLEKVFGYYQPGISIELEGETGETIRETLQFKTLEDFAPDQLGRQSRVLCAYHFKAVEYIKAARALKANRSLKQALTPGENRTALRETIKKLIAMLEPHL